MACSIAQAQITTAIKGLDEPEAVRQIFLKGLPSAFGPNVHQFQKDFASMLRKCLEQARAVAAEAQAGKQREINEAQTVLENFQADAETTKAAEHAAQALLSEKLEALKQADVTFKDEQALCDEADAAKKFVTSQREQLEAAKAEAESVKNGSLRMLIDGGWDDEEIRDACIDGVCSYFKKEGSDVVLLAALPKALKRRPAECCDFDKMAIDEAVRVVSEKVTSLEAQLAQGEEELEEVTSVYLGAWAILDVTREKAQAASEERDSADAAVKNAAVDGKLATSKVMDQDKALANIRSESALLQAKVQLIEQALEALTKLETGEDASHDDKENAMPVDVESKVADLSRSDMGVAVVA